MSDPVLAPLPAPQDLALAQTAVEIDKPLVESLELATDLLELAQIAVDLPSHRVDLGLQVALLLGLAPLGTSLRGDEAVAIDEILPVRVDRQDVLDDALH